MKRSLPKAMIACLMGLIAFSGKSSGQDEADRIELPSKESFHLFVLAGQSNMAGRGEVTEVDRQPHERVLMWSQDGSWVPAVDPMHFDKPKLVGVGLGRTFGIALAEANPDISVGLIPCAVGGTPIDSWSPGAYHQSTQTHPYDDAVRRIREASKYGTIQGILWHQGEGDSNPKAAGSYHEKLLAVLKKLRVESGGQPPVLIGQLGQFAEKPWNASRHKVDEAHRQIARELPHAVFVNSTGLLPKSDKTHFDRASIIEFGRRYYAAYHDLRNAISGGAVSEAAGATR